MAVYNKHLCRVCRPVLDYVRSQVLPDSGDIEIVSDGNDKTFIYQHNAQSLRECAEEGCDVCQPVYTELSSEDRLDATFVGGVSEMCFNFHEDEAGDLESFTCAIREKDGAILCESVIYCQLRDTASPQAFRPLLDNCQENSSTSFDILMEYQPVQDMASNALWDLMTAWLNQCSKHHGCVSHTAMALEFPSRLVRLSQCATGIEAHLVSTRAHDFVKRPYLTLSHSWGTARFLTLTSSNIQDFHTKIPLNDMKHTFTEAFDITQRLGFCYIWIDSLCIVQDSVEDWRHESARMGDIYRGSACNIAAGFHRNASRRLLDRHRQPDHIAFLQFTDVRTGRECRCWSNLAWYEAVDSLPLNKRAWVLQERLLAPRVIYFGSRQVLWECIQARACEALPEGISISGHLKSWRRILTKRLASSVGRQALDLDNPYKLWMRMVETYSQSDLTKEEDKLIALSGIAKEAQKILQDDYLAGLWKRDLLSQLLWEVEPSEKPHRRPQKYRAPSWSWASVDGSVSSGMEGPLAPLAEIVDASIQPLAEDSTGQVIGGHIQIRGLLGRIDTLSDTNSAPGEIDGKSYYIRGHQILCIFDIEEDLELGQIYYIILGFTWLGLQGLILAKTTGERNLYQRLGSFCVRADYPPLANSFLDTLKVPKELFHDMNDPMPPPSDNAYGYHSERSKITVRARDHLKPSMQLVTII